MKKDEKKSVSVPAELYRKIERRARAADFGSVDEYVESVLAEAIRGKKKRKRK